jgi:hypothetical protein
MSGRAVDTVGVFSTQAGAAAFPTALPAVPGDSLTVRGTVGESKAHLMAFIAAADAAGNKFRITSPLLHDNVTGLTWKMPENPAIFAVPEYASVELNEQDTLAVFGQSGGATTITGALVIAYDDLRGTDADLYRWHDISGDIKHIKAVEIDLNAIAVGAWTDTPLTTTEDQLHADRSYAVLGYTVSPALTVVGIKGVATGNLRMCGPGFAQTVSLSDYFVEMAEYHDRPYIPVFQANDRKAVNVSALNTAAVAGAAATVSLIVAELKTKR